MIKKAISYIWIYTILFNVIFSFLFVSPVDAEVNNNVIPQNKQLSVTSSKNYSEERVLIKFKNDTWIATLPVIQNKFSNIWLTKVDIFDKFNMWIMTFDNKLKDVDSVIAELKKINNVEYAERDYVRSIDYTWVDTNDTNSIDQWYLKSIKADDAWKIYNDNENKTIVSVNDTGLDYTNPDLVWNLKDLSSSCKSDNWATISWGCPTYWWNFEWDWSYDSLTAVLPENENFDINWHWTHVAWTIWAVWNNGTWIIWVTQNVDIMGARVETYSNEYALFYVSNVIRALNFAVLNWAKVVNASYWWTSYSQAEYDSIENAKNHWVLFVAAAWNSNQDNDGATPFYPANYNLDNIISVASIWEDDNLAYYSNYWNTSVDLAAPGGDMSEDTGILSTIPFSETVWEHNMNSFSWITLSWTWTNWSIRNNNYIETNSWAYIRAWTYTWSEDKSLIFNEKIDLTWAKFAKLDWHIECELQTWDEFEILLNDQSIWLATTYWTYARSVNYWNIVLPIPSNLYTSNLELKINFKSNSDNNYDYGCAIDNFKIIAYDDTKHSYESMQWTSMATPVVVWVASMLWSYKPELSFSEIKNIIFSSLDVLPSLNTKVLTSWKINAKNAIKELISRYWITKNGAFDGETFNTPNIVLSSKNLTLSWSIINITSTGSVMSLTWSTITWSWTIKVWTGTSNNAFSTSSDFDIVLKNINWTNLNYSGSTVYWESLKLDYTWNLTWSNLNLKLKSGENVIYDWVLTKDLIFPINSSFSWAINSYVYKNGDTSHWIGSWVVLQVLDKTTINNINFQYTPSIFTWTLNFDSWINTSDQFTYVHLTSTHYPVNYQISWNLARSYTGTLNNSWSILVELTPWDWIKTLSWKLENLNHQFSQNFTWSIEFKSAPSWSFSSPLYVKTTWTSINLQSSEYPIDYKITWDLVATITWSLSSSWAVNIGLTSWNWTKSLNVEFTDRFWNKSPTYTGSIVLDQTLPNISILSHNNNDSVSADYITLTWSVSDNNTVSSLKLNWALVGLNSNNFSKSILLVLWNNNITYEVIDVAWNTKTWLINIIRTATTYDVDSSSEPSNNTGSVLFIGTSATSTWVTFNSTGTLDLVSTDWKNKVILSLSWLTINSNSWDLIFNPPAQTTFSWTFSNVWYNHVSNLSYSIWNNDSELDLVWWMAQVKLFVWTIYNWKTLWVFRSINKWINYSYLTDCLVSNWICSFETDKFSLYTLWLPSDSVPNNFSFTDVINSELSTENISNTITVSWTNTWSLVSIINWFYSINSWLFTNLSWIVHELDQIRVKLISSAANSTIVNSILNIWWVSDTYSVTTKASSSSSSSWWGGGSSSWGWWWRSYPVCLDSQLTCKVVSWSTTTFKWYKKDGFTCIWWNLWKICDKSLVEKVEDIVKPTIIVNWKELEYIKYENTKIQQIQALLFNKLKSKKPTILTYVLVNKVVLNLNRILTDKSLSKAEIKKLKAETISTYKKYLAEYKKLPNVQKTK